jgi:hypothetical protein
MGSIYAMQGKQVRSRLRLGAGGRILVFSFAWTRAPQASIGGDKRAVTVLDELGTCEG